MARARNIKPGFYKNEDLAECSIWARFIFPGLWMLADRDGRLEDRPKRIKGELLPFDTQDVEPLLQELASRKFIERYEIDGIKVIQIPKFRDHQTPHWQEKQSSLPPRFQESPPVERASNLGEAQESPPVERASKPKTTKINRPFKGVENPSDSLNPDSLNPDSLNPDTGSSVVDPQPESRDPTPENATRKGALCRQLRTLGIDAAPHLQGWAELLPAYSDAEILAAAEQARDKKPGERLHLNYLLPILRDRAAPPSSRNGKPEKFDPVAYVNRNRTSSQGDGNASDSTVINGTAERVA